jgi:hypothetical protein
LKACGPKNLGAGGYANFSEFFYEFLEVIAMLFGYGENSNASLMSAIAAGSIFPEVIGFQAF